MDKDKIECVPATSNQDLGCRWLCFQCRWGQCARRNVLQGLLEVTLITKTVSHVSRWDLFLDKKITLKNILDRGSQPVSNYSIKKINLQKILILSR